MFVYMDKLNQVHGTARCKIIQIKKNNSFPAHQNRGDQEIYYKINFINHSKCNHQSIIGMVANCNFCLDNGMIAKENMVWEPTKNIEL